jgi:hypothetical protein
MAIRSEAASRSSVVDPEKWLSILQRWHPREPREVLVDFINDLIEAAGPQRVERLDVLFVHTDETTRSAREKSEKLRRWRDRMRSDPWFWPQLVERHRPVSVLVRWAARCPAILDQGMTGLIRLASHWSSVMREQQDVN